MDLKNCDQTHDLIIKEIKKRKLDNLSLAELLRWETKIIEIKDKKMDALIKYKHFSS